MRNVPKTLEIQPKELEHICRIYLILDTLHATIPSLKHRHRTTSLNPRVVDDNNIIITSIGNARLVVDRV